MSRAKVTIKTAVESVLRHCLSHRNVLKLDEVGALRVGKDGELEIEPAASPRVFIGYASEDTALVRRLARQLRAAGLRPWLDQEQLVPGQNWPRAIERAIQSSDFAIQCFSTNSVSRRGYFHKELRLVLETASRVPFDEVYFLPIRFEPCHVPDRVTSQYQYVDLFPSWNEGIAALVEVMLKQHAHRLKSCDTT